MVGVGKGVPGFAVASRSCCAGIARSAASDAAPTLVANLIPFCSASARGTADNVPRTDPLSPIAPAIRCFDNGEAIWVLTESDPADSPAIVTLFGSPPKAAIFRRTHRKAAL